MRWEVRGADASTGDDRLLVVEGLNSDDVEAKARFSGMLVASITPIVSTAPVVAYAMPEQQGKIDSSPIFRDVPREKSLYTSLRVGAKVLQAIGVVVGVGALLSIGLGFQMLTDNQKENGVLAVMFGLVLLVTGVAAHVVGSMALAVRDIALNSKPKPVESAQRNNDAAPST